MTTWTQRRSDIRDELQETTAGFWSQAELLKWANRAYRRIYRAMKVDATSSLTLASGTESYSLPSDFYLARRVEIQTLAGSSTSWTALQAISLDLRRPADPLATATLTAQPTGFYIFNNKLYFAPIPDAAYSGTLYYFKYPTALVNDNDSLVYPEGIDSDRFDEAIDWYVIGQALRKRQDPAYTTYLGDFQALLNQLSADAAERGSAEPLLVRDDWASE